MLSKKYIFLGFCISNLAGYAQDSLSVKNDVFIERNSIDRVLYREMNNLSSLKPRYFSQNYTSVQIGYNQHSKKKYDWQEGSGQQDLTFQSETHQILTNDLTVWGKAHFKSIQSKDIRFNENLDYRQIYPYFLADTVGGDLKVESYHFGGGLAKSFDKWVLGVEGYLTANQGYRKIDPRPLNKSTTIDVKGSVSRDLGLDHTLSLGVDYEFYKQTSRLSFVSLLGRPLIFNLNGPGVYSNLLTGMGPSGSSQALAYYENTTLRGTLLWSPKNSGFYAKGIVEQRVGDKYTNHTNEAINFFTDEQLQVDLGYIQQYNNWYWKAVGTWNSRRMSGADGLFNTVSTSAAGGYEKFADRSSYRYFSDRYAGTLLFGSSNIWNAQVEVAYQELQEQYISPFRNMSWSPLDISLTAQYFYHHRNHILETTVQVANRSIHHAYYTFTNVNLESEIGNLLNNNWDYRISKPIFAEMQLQYLINLNNGKKPFVKLNAGYASEVELSRFALHLGLNF